MTTKQRGFAHIAAYYASLGAMEEAHQLARQLLPWARRRALEEDETES